MTTKPETWNVSDGYIKGDQRDMYPLLFQPLHASAEEIRLAAAAPRLRDALRAIVEADGSTYDGRDGWHLAHAKLCGYARAVLAELDPAPVVKVDALAREFSRVLREWLTPAQMVTVNARNALPGNERFCASHDFCDANQAMLDAFEKLHGREHSSDSDADTNLINAAWDTAKAARFYP